MTGIVSWVESASRAHCRAKSAIFLTNQRRFEPSHGRGRPVVASCPARARPVGALRAVLSRPRARRPMSTRVYARCWARPRIVDMAIASRDPSRKLEHLAACSRRVRPWLSRVGEHGGIMYWLKRATLWPEGARRAARRKSERLAKATA